MANTNPQTEVQAPKLARLRIEAVLEYDADMIHGVDPESIRWFLDDLLMNTELILHSNEIGDAIGVLKITSVAQV